MKARRIKGLDPEGSFAANAARMVSVRLDELRSFAPAALRTGGSKVLHDMRIAAKRLRYVLEVSEGVLGKRAVTAGAAARELQDVIGEIHDCDVMRSRVLEHVERLRHEDALSLAATVNASGDLPPESVQRASHRTAYRGLEVLAAYMEGRRELLFRRFVDAWDRFEGTKVWEGLESAAGSVAAGQTL